MKIKTIASHNKARCRDNNNQYGERNVLGNLGNVYPSLGQQDKAIQHLKQAFLIFEEIKSPYAERTRQKLAKLEAR
ncbi:MAG: hypothetical protein KAR13_02725 [Desulfobulbaceae bacterium]|nr:hypothetical protein [Desulfobulbaceae bacterium]